MIFFVIWIEIVNAVVRTNLIHFNSMRQSNKMAKYTQTIRWQIADELFECVSSFCETGA